MGKFMGHDDRERKFEKALERHLRQGAPRDAGAAAHSQADPACPDAALLAAFHERMLSNEEMDAAKAHIAACARCQEILALLEATDDVVADVPDRVDVEQEKVLELRAPVFAGSPAQEEEYLPGAATPGTVPRATVASKAPPSISTGRGKVWRWVAPAAAVAAGLIIWVTAHNKLKHSANSVSSLEVAQEKPADRQFDDRLAPVPAASAPEETRENGRVDQALKSLNESKRPATALSARRAPAGTRGGAIGGTIATPSARTRSELPLQGRNSDELAPAKPAGKVARQEDLSVTAAAPSVDTNAVELDRAAAKGRKKADSPATPANAPASTVAGNAPGVAGGQNARDSGRKISPKEKLEPGLAGELSASSAPSPQPAAPPPPAARTAAKQSADATQKKEAGANAMTATTEQTQVTANYESAASLQNDKAGLAKTTEAKTNSKMKDSQLILTPGGTVLWRLRAGGKIERSTDRGITWTPQNTGAKLELLAGSAPSDAVCWLAGRAGTILRTTDGGGYWSKVVSPITGDVGGIRAEDAQHATIFGAGNNTRFATSDGGATWTPAQE
jgi:hypothetical protein